MRVKALLVLVVSAAVWYLISTGNTSRGSHTVHIDADGTVSNWFGNYKWKPASIREPSSLEELQNLLREVNKTNEGRQEKLRVRAVGALHSWSAIAEIDGGVMIRTEKLNRVLHVDKENLRIKAEAGILTAHLYEIMHQHGLALLTLPNTIQITLGGMVAVAAHGTMRASGTMSSYITEIEIVDYTGTLHKFSNDSTSERDQERFEAAIVSLGNLGVIYSVTLQCVREYNVIVHTFSFPVSRIKGQIARLMEETPSLFLLMLEGKYNYGLAKTIHPIPSEIADPTWHPFGWITEFVDECFAIAMNELNADRFWGKYRIGYAVRHLVQYPFFMKWLSKERTKVMTWDEGEIIIKVWKDRAFLNCEYQVPIENADAAYANFWKRAQEFREKGLYNRVGPIFLRGTQADPQGYMSTTKGDSKAYVSFDVPYQLMDEQEFKFYEAVEEDFVKFGGKLNLARRYNAKPEVIFQSYPDVDKFVKIMREMDPHRIFSNKMMDSLFGDK
jgi:FAD/FMN-containing dehydrogenase